MGSHQLHPKWAASSQLALQLDEQLLRFSYTCTPALQAGDLAGEAAGAIRGWWAAGSAFCAAALLGK